MPGSALIVLQRLPGPRARAPCRCTATLCNRSPLPGKGEDALGERCVLAAKVMPGADLLACRYAGRQARADRVLLALTVQAQDWQVRDPAQLRLRRRAGLIAADPVADPHFEGRIRVDAEQVHAHHSVAQVGG